MKTLVVYYSRTGVTRKVAEEIAGLLGADLEEIVDTKGRKGVLGWFGGVKDALRKKSLPIGPIRCDPGEYDLVLIGTPVWAGTMATAVRTYLTEFASNIRRAAFFCTMHSSDPSNTFRDMQRLCGKPPAGTLAFRQKNVEKDEHLDEVRSFVELLKEQ